MIQPDVGRLLAIVGIALAAHLTAWAISAGSRRLLRSRLRSEAKLLTVTAVRQNVIQAMRQLDAKYADWMVSVHYRAEPGEGSRGAALPRPSVLSRRAGRGEAR